MKRTNDASPARERSAMSNKLRRRSAIGVLLASAVAFVLALPALASANPLGSVEFFKTGLRSTANVLYTSPGPDGNVWFVDNINPSGIPAIGKITSEGTITEYIGGETLSGLNAGSSLIGITALGKNLWFTDRGTTPAIGFIDSTSPGAATEYSIQAEGGNAGSGPQGIVAGPDGKLWFADNGTTPAIGYFDPTAPAGERVKEFSTGLPVGSRPRGIVVGSDGALWFTDQGEFTRGIGRIDPTTKVIEEFPTGANSIPGSVESTLGQSAIAAGPDGNIWFTEGKEGARGICKIEVSAPHAIECFSAGLLNPELPVGSKPLGLTQAGGKLWFTDGSGVLEKQVIKFEGTWATGNEFELCNEGKTKCIKKAYSTTLATLRTNVKTAYEEIYGVGSVGLPSCSGTPFTCTVTFSPTMGATNVGQTSCEAKTGAGTCSGTTSTEGVPNAIGRITTSGKITRYPIEGLSSVGSIGSVSSSDVWFPTGAGTLQKIGKFGIEVPKFPLTVTKTGSGTGTVQCDTGSGPEACEAEYEEGTEVSLTATAESGSVFKGWSGSGCSGTGTCEVTMSEAKEVTAEFALKGEKLTVTKEGTGDGTVVSNPAGIECGGTCEAEFAKESKVTLTVSPDSESLFVSWKGCETGGVNGRQCKVTMDKAKTVVAKFIQAYDVSVTRKGTGLGKISSTPSGILCLSNCSSTSAKFKELTNVTLTAAPSKNFTFAGWSGDCVGTGTCVLSSLSEDKEVEAEFLEVAKHVLSMSKKGGGQGTVKTNLPGINCGATCSSMGAAFYQGSEVELTQTPGKGSTFGGWSGDCSGTGTCKVTMSSAKSVEAEFK